MSFENQNLNQRKGSISSKWKILCWQVLVLGLNSKYIEKKLYATIFSVSVNK